MKDEYEAKLKKQMECHGRWNQITFPINYLKCYTLLIYGVLLLRCHVHISL